MSVGLSHPEHPPKLDPLPPVADLAKLALSPSPRRLGTLRRRVARGTYWVEPKAISRQITDFYQT